MQENQNVEIVRRAYEAFGRGDMEALLSTFDEQVEWITPGAPDLPTAGRRQGRTEVAGFFKTLGDMVEIEQFVPREFIAQGDHVVVIGDEVARLRSNGKRIEVAWCHVSQIKDGRIVSFHEYFDTAPVVEALREKAAASGR
jgi:ketosteroid isomerase-like protein